jgi:hypothetical protein
LIEATEDNLQSFLIPPHSHISASPLQLRCKFSAQAPVCSALMPMAASSVLNMKLGAASVVLLLACSIAPAFALLDSIVVPSGTCGEPSTTYVQANR